MKLEFKSEDDRVVCRWDGYDNGYACFYVNGKPLYTEINDKDPENVKQYFDVLCEALGTEAGE